MVTDKHTEMESWDELVKNQKKVQVPKGECPETLGQGVGGQRLIEETKTQRQSCRDLVRKARERDGDSDKRK